jgi:non-canonical (house-cleaning) NTP pyrophosphatase
MSMAQDVQAARATITIAATTKNPEKLESIDRAFTDFFRERAHTIEALPSESGIPHGQPWGHQHTYEGAVARISDLKGQEGRLAAYEYIVSAENGVCGILTHTQTLAIDVCCVVVEHRASGKQTFSFSQSRPYPLASVQEKKRRGEKGIGKWCAEYYRTAALPVSRADQIFTATTMALAQLVNPNGVAYSSSSNNASAADAIQKEKIDDGHLQTKHAVDAGLGDWPVAALVALVAAGVHVCGLVQAAALSIGLDAPSAILKLSPFKGLAPI